MIGRSLAFSTAVVVLSSIPRSEVSSCPETIGMVDIFRMEDGKIAEHWDVADTFTFFSQLGLTRGAEDRQRKG